MRSDRPRATLHLPRGRGAGWRGGAPEMAFDGILWGLCRYQVLECGYGDLGGVMRPCQVMAGEAGG
jgi:hypothetical protein